MIPIISLNCNHPENTRSALSVRGDGDWGATETKRALARLWATPKVFFPDELNHSTLRQTIEVCHLDGKNAATGNASEAKGRSSWEIVCQARS
jgi:hypothetical protein